MIQPSQRLEPAPATLPATVLPPEDAGRGARHADYDLHPLPVESLAHYIECRLEDGRFRVS
ncbi:hypothetical protein QMK61_13690 [Fulvimonas sp. R45]|uniref:hypothetical protein n=1 Tax=Fulvimonas sp. R45 TaxID=3045937 RepID=UPI00265E60E4|nr:hypothetical protein [Fulvimonas sp. R45]MDO1529886.1 hypothetical protein [Fulvimonas sp. R45]